jgi:hypothetical protein
MINASLKNIDGVYLLSYYIFFLKGKGKINAFSFGSQLIFLSMSFIRSTKSLALATK